MPTLSFWGAAGTVTGSKYLIESDHGRVLIDCGLFQGLKELRLRNWEEPPFNAAFGQRGDHYSCSTSITRDIYRAWSGMDFADPCYCSRGTAELMKILLPDAARLQEEEADYRNRHKITKHLPALPLYTEQDAREALKLLQVVPNTGEQIHLVKGFAAEFRIAGHILGSSQVLVQVRGRRTSQRSFLRRPGQVRPANHS